MAGQTQIAGVKEDYICGNLVRDSLFPYGCMRSNVTLDFDGLVCLPACLKLT